MTQVAVAPAPSRELRTVRILVGLAVLGVLVAVAAGLTLWLVSPDDGSTAEGILGITAAASGLATAVFAIAAVVYAQVKNLWRHAPMWLRVAVGVIGVVAIVTTLWNLATQAV